MEVDMCNEDYVLQRARTSLKSNPYAAKCWIITAKTLYPNNFNVQFEAYCIEKDAGNVQEAAKCFSDLIMTFQQESELWQEVERVTAALRSDGTKTEDVHKDFLCEMFKHISPEVQHKLLLCTADHCEDTLEHCRLLLLLLQRFPTTVASYGTRLVDTLITAEKHNADGSFPLNPYRKLLISELLPLLHSVDIKLDLNPKSLLKLGHKAVEFYACILGLGNTVPSIENEQKIENPWDKLFSIIEFIGKQLGWDSNLVNLSDGKWSKETYWQKLLNYYQNGKRNGFDERQFLFCGTVFFLHCVQEYTNSLCPESGPGQSQIAYILTEAFVDNNLSCPLNEPKSKKKKCDESVPYISVERNDMKAVCTNFHITCSCWDLLTSTEHFHKEFGTFNAYLKVDKIINDFVIDYAIYKCKYDEALSHLQKNLDNNSTMLYKYVRIVGILYLKKKYTSCFEHILLAIPLLPNINMGSLSSQLVCGGNQRHLHYLPLTYIGVLQYFAKILLRSIRENSLKHSYSELAIGHMLTLCQIDWPEEEEIVPALLDQIQHYGSFNYPVFQNYIINVDILEEIAYLTTKQGGQIALDILPHMGQRRIGTRGADRGAKEEIRQIIKKQVARCNDNVNELLVKFFTHERGLILQTLI